MESPPGKDPIPDPPSPNHNVGQVGEPSAGGADRADARGSGKRPLDRAEGVTRFEPCAQRNFGVFLSDRGDAHGSEERPVDCWELLGKRRDHADALGSGSGKSRGEDVLGLVGAAHGSGEPPVDSAIVPVPAPDARGSGKRPLDRAELITRLDLNPLRNRTKACSQRNLDLFLSDDELSSVLGSDSGSDSSSSSALDNEEAPAMVPAPVPVPAPAPVPVPVPIPAPERSVAKRSRFQFTSAAPDIPADAPRARRVVGAINDGKGSVMPVYAEDEKDDDEFDHLWDSFEFDAEAEPDSTLPPITTWPKIPDTSRRGPLTKWDVEVFLFSMFADGFMLNMEVIRQVLGSCGYDIKKSMEKLISEYELVTNQRRFPYQKPAVKALEDISPSSTDLPVKIIPCSKEPVVRDEDDYQNYLMDAKQHWDVMKQYYEKAIDAFEESDKNYELYIRQGKHYHKMAQLSEEKYYAQITRSKSSKTSSGSFYWLSR